MNGDSFFSNDTNPSFLSGLKDRLSRCNYFDWSVSFIKKAGLILLIQDIKNALLRGAKGRILTSTYQNFTDISSLEEFMSLQEQFPNSFECHLEFDSFGDAGFHTKGYLFGYENGEEAIIGSSNITRFALLKNKEWDLAISKNPNDPTMLEVKKAFNYLWSKTPRLNRDDMKRYSLQLEYAISVWDMDTYALDKEGALKPNTMQRKALKELQRVRNMNVDRALIVAATGSGKTYLSAFDALEFDAKRLLFVVHKDMILKEAQKTFENVFGTKRTFGLFVDGISELDRDFVFASNQSLALHLERFDPKEFDYIIIDEVHHAAASTYQKIINYFKPAFLLGMTATPDRMDEQSIYDIFGNNVPYDLRLRDAIENDLVVPFHYYGIKDSLLDYSDDPSKAESSVLVKQLVAQEHIEFVVENIEKYRPKGMGKLKCVGFCRNIEHARQMAEQMSKAGYVSSYLTGASNIRERSDTFARLQDETDPLQIVFAVDILNEGIDIPSMNMVLFLRPTDSSTILLQQLGRGLRKYQNKKYLTVLDFIGNSYKRAVQIAIALGTLTESGMMDPATMHDIIMHPTEMIEIPGLVVKFDAESQEEILTSFESTNFNSFKFLEQDYKNFKKYLKDNGSLQENEYPRCVDFLNAEISIDLLRFKTKQYPSYYDFLARADDGVLPIFDDQKINVIRTLSTFLPLIRKDEYSIVSVLLNGETHKATLSSIKNTLSLDPDFDEESFVHALRVLSGKAIANFGDSFIPLLKIDGQNIELSFDLSNPEFKTWIEDMIGYGLARFETDFYGKKGLLKPFSAYTGAQAFMAINNYKADTDQPNLMYMSGVHYTEKGLCLFVNLNKDAQKEERLKYKDKFLSENVLQWESQTSTTLTNSKGRRLIETGKAMIFIRKTKNGDPPFMYIGEGHLQNPRDSGNEAKALLFDIKLENPIPMEYRYDFGITEEDD